jgi:hypothetical protein
MRAPLLLPFAALVLTACDHSSSGSVTPTGSSSSATQAPAPSATAATAPSASASADPEPTEGLGNPPRLADADIETLEKGMKCNAAAAAKPGPCKVLATMEKCNDWNAVSPSGDGRYIGHGWQVAGAATTDIVTVLRSRSVPKTDVKPSQLPIKIAIGSIGPDANAAFIQSERAISAFARHDVPPPKNAAVELLKTKSDWKDDAPAAKTMGSMIETMGERPTYICQGPGQQIEVVQQASADIGLKSDGLYAELWAATW